MSAGRGDVLFPTAFVHDTDAGRLVGIRLGPAPDAGRDALLAALHPDERPFAETLRGARLVEFAAGRVAARRAAGDDDPTLRGPGGAPHRAGARVSISHSRMLAVALVAPDAGPYPGIDIEPLYDHPADHLLAGRILAPEEAADGAPPLVVRLSLKEATFKALHPLLGPVPLRRIVVGTGPDGAPRLDVADPGIRLAATVTSVADHVLAIVSAEGPPRRTASSAPAASPIGIQKVSHIQSVGVRMRS